MNVIISYFFIVAIFAILFKVISLVPHMLPVLRDRLFYVMFAVRPPLSLSTSGLFFFLAGLPVNLVRDLVQTFELVTVIIDGGSHDG